MSSRLAALIVVVSNASVALAEMPRVELGKTGKEFILAGTGKPFTPWGFNYDHDASGRLIEDYWETEWPSVEGDFEEMKELGANVVRVHLQLGRFMEAADRPNEAALARLAKLLALSEKVGLYLDLTGLGCYHKADVPAWYDALSEEDRWKAQAAFWKAVAGTCAKSPAVFCYDLMNEPVVPGGKRKPGDWLGPAFGDKHFVQVISLDQRDRKRPEIAKAWINVLVKAIREVDSKHLVTVGLVDWSLDRKGLTSGFVPSEIAADLDFLCIHLYPERGKTKEALETLAGFAAAGKPVVIEETFPLKCPADEFESFLDASKPHARGWISFYWGQPPAELRKANTIPAAILADWLERFRKRGVSFPAN